LPREPGLVANLALPIPMPHQTALTITDWEPKELVRHRREGMILGFPLWPNDAEVIRIGYSFQCRLAEGELCEAPPRADAEVPVRFLTPTLPLKMLPALRRFLASLLPERPLEPAERVRRVHEWLFEECDLLSASAYVSACAGVAPREQLTELFINLCQLAGVPARAQTAVPLHVHADGSARAADFRCLFFQSCAEVWLPKQGWRSIEISSARAAPAALRADGSESHSAQRRIYGSEFAARVPTIAIRRDGWQAMDVGFSALHTLDGSFTSEVARA